MQNKRTREAHLCATMPEGVKVCEMAAATSNYAFRWHRHGRTACGERH